jgi:DNA-binding NarL/FixJ family response regulator
VVVDDHPVVRRGIRALLDSLAGFEVVGEAADGAAAVRETQLTRPDVVLMDLRMPGTDGIEATRRIVRSSPGSAVLVLTMSDDDATVLAAMQAGARGYLLKGAEQEEIVRALRSVVAGEVIFGPGVAARVLAHLASPVSPTLQPRPFPELTEREHEVLALLATGLRTAAIATRLHLSPKTVSNVLTAVFAKLQVAGRAEAMVRARAVGIAAPDPPGSRRDAP